MIISGKIKKKSQPTSFSFGFNFQTFKMYSYNDMRKNFDKKKQEKEYSLQYNRHTQTERKREKTYSKFSIRNSHSLEKKVFAINTMCTCAFLAGWLAG